ncbi:MAG TPA: flagellar protein FliT [Methylotenera sp.]|nr:flagellar protein FliT [Methylotenera sp.]HPH04984.1 flagellar protein FliT [Methylotenera sp.]HPN00246.1 flagellar protein FliT [Methylotenera sp.]
METQNTVALYESVAGIMNRMLNAAKQQEWDTLAELEGNCAQLVQMIKVVESSDSLSEEELARKLSSVKTILGHDREIRNLVSPWMAKLNALMNSNQMEQKLSQAYKH